MRKTAALIGALLSVMGAAIVGPVAYADFSKVVITVGFSPGGGNDPTHACWRGTSRST